MRKFRVKLHVFRGADRYPIRRRTLTVESDTALDACCRAEDVLNVQVAENEYAAAMSVMPIRNPRPAMPMALPMAA
jgi:hypothetical protein